MVSFTRQTMCSMFHLPQHEYCLSILYVCSKSNKDQITDGTNPYHLEMLQKVRELR